MRVVLAAVRYPPAPGGAETHVSALAEGLAKRGHDVEVHASDLFTEYPFAHRDMPADVNGVKVVRHRAKRLAGSWTTMPTMPRALREAAKNADLVHAHSYGYYQTTAAARAAKNAGKPFVFTPHYHPPWSMEGGALRRVLRGVYDPTLGAAVVRAADRIIAVSQGELAEMRRHLKVDLAKVRVVPNGFDAGRFDPIPDPEGVRYRLGLPAATPLVVYAGRLASNKGLPILISAFARVALEDERPHLLLAGEDQGIGPALREQARSLGVAERVHFLGHVTSAEYRETIAAADVFALASEWEAFGIVLVEAMACAVPCVATRVGGAPDVVVDGETGRLVPYGDKEAMAAAILELLRDPGLAMSMGDAGRKRAFSEFAWDAVVEKTLGVYRELV